MELSVRFVFKLFDLIVLFEKGIITLYIEFKYFFDPFALS